MHNVDLLYAIPKDIINEVFSLVSIQETLP
jgi:hypothetical protein